MGEKDQEIAKLRKELSDDRSTSLADFKRMYEEMNKHNAKFIFGTLSWRESSEDPGTGMIIMEHNLLGEYMDLAEFGTCLTALAFTADELDDTFQAMFGGERWAD